MRSSSHRRRWVVWVVGTYAASVLALGGCDRSPPAPRPLLVFGIDGGEWKAIERLWSEGRLPALRRIAERGSRAVLETFSGSSPVIWTTMATGLRPEEHGITDFVVTTPRGDRPLTSTVRKAPALWNMLSSAGRRVAVLGFWATWPAEPVAGVMVSDRVREMDLADRVHPPSFTAEVDASYRRAVAEGAFPDFRPEVGAEARDLAVAAAARTVAGTRPLPDLLLVYFRAVDVVSHSSWGDFESRGAAGRDDVTRLYEAVDQAIGEILGAAGGLDAVNVLVISDHGFKAAPRPKVVVRLDFDRVLERLGYLRRAEAGIDPAHSRAMTLGSPRHRPTKRIRFLLAGRDPGGVVPAAQSTALARSLRTDLEGVRWAGGEAVFRWRDLRSSESAAGADAVAEVNSSGAALPVMVSGRPWAESAIAIDRLTGRHDASTHGVLLAAGPDVAARSAAAAAAPPRPGARDVAPTVLYALGLPYGRDFAGRPFTALFTAEFRARNPLRAVSSWGRRDATGALDSSADEKLIEELRALGYLD